MIALAALYAVAVLAAEPQAAPEPSPAAAPSATASDARAADVRRLHEASGSAKLAGQVMGPMFAQLGKLMPDVPASVWREIEGEMSPDDLVEQLVPIYVRHLSADEVKQLIAFYESPVGRALVAKLPAITQESFQAGTLWGQAAARRVIERLRAKGYEPKLQPT